jgi:hypothetical protein
MVRRSSTQRLILVGGILAISCKCVVVTVHISSVPYMRKFKKILHSCVVRIFGRNLWLDNKVYDLLVRSSFHLTHGILGRNPAINVIDMTWHDPIIVNPAVIWINQSSQVQDPGLLMQGKIHINILLWLRVLGNVSFWQGGSSPNSWIHYGLIVETQFHVWLTCHHSTASTVCRVWSKWNIPTRLWNV